jgi:hypothetical protein
VRLKWRGAAGSAGACQRGAAGGGAEQQRKQRGRGERETTRTWLEFFKSARTPLQSKIFFQTIAQMQMCPKAKV